MKKIDFEVLNPYGFYIPPQMVKCDALWPRWWHKLIFWKKWVYPEWIVEGKKMWLPKLKKVIDL